MNNHLEWKSLRIDYRHLAFFFIGAVAVGAVFFAVGFVVGRAQAFETALRQTETNAQAAGESTPEASGAARSDKPVPAADAEKPTVNETNASGDYRKELDFYSSLKGQKVDQNFHPETAQTTKQRRANESKADVARLAATQKAKLDGSGSLITLQVAALKSAPEADKLVKSLRSKGYPVFIVNPSREDANRLIRVQVGPYGSEAEAAKMKSRLGTDGYTAITKR